MEEVVHFRACTNFWLDLFELFFFKKGLIGFLKGPDKDYVIPTMK